MDAMAQLAVRTRPNSPRKLRTAGADLPNTHARTHPTHARTRTLNHAPPLHLVCTVAHAGREPQESSLSARGRRRHRRCDLYTQQAAGRRRRQRQLSRAPRQRRERAERCAFAAGGFAVRRRRASRTSASRQAHRHRAAAPFGGDGAAAPAAICGLTPRAATPEGGCARAGGIVHHSHPTDARGITSAAGSARREGVARGAANLRGRRTLSHRTIQHVHRPLAHGYTKCRCEPLSVVRRAQSAIACWCTLCIGATRLCSRPDACSRHRREQMLDGQQNDTLHTP